jgi:Ca-activated chloride channel family protein
MPTRAQTQRMWNLSLVALYSFFVLPFSLHGQDLPVFRAKTDLVVVPVTVTDRSGRFVRNLTVDQFELVDGGTRRPIAHFSADRAPVSLGILLDISGSMTTDVNARAALKLLVTRLDPHDEVFFSVFNEKVSLVVPWTHDHTRLSRAVDTVQPGGTTALLEAVKLIAPAFQLARYPRKVLLLISDGNDTRLPPALPIPGYGFADAATARQADIGERRRRLRELMIGGATDAIAKSEAGLYAIGLGPDPQLMNLGLLQNLTADSGGYVELPRGAADLAAAVARVCDELQSQYLLGFEPSRADGQTHSIKVTVKNSNLKVRSRAAYVAK